MQISNNYVVRLYTANGLINYQCIYIINHISILERITSSKKTEKRVMLKAIRKILASRCPADILHNEEHNEAMPSKMQNKLLQSKFCIIHTIIKNEGKIKVSLGIQSIRIFISYISFPNNYLSIYSGKKKENVNIKQEIKDPTRRNKRKSQHFRCSANLESNHVKTPGKKKNTR